MSKIRRDRLKIYGDLLAALNEEAKNEKIVLTRVQLRTNLPFTRLKGFIQELIRLKLIKDEDSLKLTEKGRQYLKEYDHVLKFIRRMGITYR
jgi:predicted transcriptional regulator